MTYFTVSGKDTELVRTPSSTVNVMVLVPSLVVSKEGRLVPGVICRNRVLPEPLSVRLATKPAGLSAELVTVTVKLLALTLDELTVS